MGLLRRSLSSVRWRSLWVFLPWDCLASPFHTEASAAHFHTEDKRDTRAHYADSRFFLAYFFNVPCNEFRPA